MQKIVEIRNRWESRERESYTLKKKSMVLFDSLTHTSSLKNNKYNIKNKGNIIMPCEIDTG